MVSQKGLSLTVVSQKMFTFIAHVWAVSSSCLDCFHGCTENNHKGHRWYLKKKSGSGHWRCILVMGCLNTFMNHYPRDRRVYRLTWKKVISKSKKLQILFGANCLMRYYIVYYIKTRIWPKYNLVKELLGFAVWLIKISFSGENKTFVIMEHHKNTPTPKKQLVHASGLSYAGVGMSQPLRSHLIFKSLIRKNTRAQTKVMNIAIHIFCESVCSVC